MTAELPAYVTLDDVVEVAGVDREVLLRHLKRRGALRRFGKYHHVDTSALSRVEHALYQRLLQRHVQRALGIEDGCETKSLTVHGKPRVTG
jgi:hypothetical protein